MRNAEWMIDKGMSFADLAIEQHEDKCDIFYKDNIIDTIEGRANYTIGEWLDRNHFQITMTSKEYNFIKQVCDELTPYNKQRVIWICGQKNGERSLVIVEEDGEKDQEKKIIFRMSLGIDAFMGVPSDIPFTEQSIVVERGGEVG